MTQLAEAPPLRSAVTAGDVTSYSQQGRLIRHISGSSLISNSQSQPSAIPNSQSQPTSASLGGDLRMTLDSQMMSQPLTMQLDKLPPRAAATGVTTDTAGVSTRNR